ncbi:MULTISPECIES: hypothetical protein [Thermoanaerobacter]|uniref:DUF4380 domain-containing protein n=2 Tax=Thermoanaerobacter TaxID=1754 RepID=B0K7M1_THEP3|nr:MULTISPECIES: hypothetical protein [Thermoanaerobacter]ABY94270.1 hypothetical protein Teth39_0606 [Thermoanaerobacter pseudethanolicus ATCC 33223]ADV79223.1 hypothetical protein Thebr_0624 [Thermoanaerobacter brockii subsp. finnii Ako-1]HBW60520.1 hypothetical protein [Thermoanaerobacter sp.]
MAIKIDKINFLGWENSIKLSNGIIDVVATTDIGPRIVRFGFENDVNEFNLDPKTIGLKGGDEYRYYGGHRLWHSPEDRKRTYIPDNDEVDWHEIENGVRLIQKPEKWVNTQKQIDIILSPDESRVRLVHRITNLGAWPIELSAWTITVLNTEGIEIIPQPNKDTDLLPNRQIVLWPYSKMNDKRVYWGEKYIALKQDPNNKAPFKLGINNQEGWAAYARGGHLFVKRYYPQHDTTYPDFGVSFETYTNDWMLEIETLSPFTKLQPGETVEHVEEWELYNNVNVKDIDEGAFDEVVEKYCRK